MRGFTLLLLTAAVGTLMFTGPTAKAQVGVGIEPGVAFKSFLVPIVGNGLYSVLLR
jgi:hypothetical protein